MRILSALLVGVVVTLAGCFHAQNGTGGGDGGDEPTISAVAFTKTPANAAEGSRPVVCWRVDGTGKIPHTAVHFDSVSRASASAFSAYQGGAAYPNNATMASEVTLPGSFCTSIQLNSTMKAGSKLYLRAHALAGQKSVLSTAEGSITVKEAGADTVTSVDVVSAAAKAPKRTGAPSPVTVTANETFVVCWKLVGKGNVSHTAVHWGPASKNSTGTKFSDYPNAAYPDNKSAGDVAKFAIGSTYCTGIKAPVSGKIYYRAHAIDADGGTGKLSNEYQLDVLGKATTIAFAPNPPSTFAKDKNMTICWRITGEGVVPHTAVHTDTASHAGDNSIAAYPTAWYPDNATAAAPAGYTLPGTFCTFVKTPNQSPASFYLRAHVLSAAGHLLSDEKQVILTPV